MGSGIGSPWRFFDERHPRGGRFKSWLFLTHPGPSLLVTAVTVATAGLLTRRVPTERTAVGLVLVMLPAQLAIGTLNDWADARADARSKPFKPLARATMRRGDALALAGVLLAVSAGTAAWLGGSALGVALLGIGAGVGYDLVLKRTPFALLAWWAGFTAVPLLAMVVTGRLRGGVETVPLAGLLALALQLANGLPDIDGDRSTGARTLPSLLGEGRSRWLMSAALVGAAGYALALKEPLHQSGLALMAAAVLGAGATAGLLPRAARRATFPLLACCVAAATVCWVAALPPPPG
jgi:4-hydroxybenzoate polyprenyltransferase